MNPQPQRPCATCGRPFPLLANNPRKRYCTPRCRVADWHFRNDRLGRRPAAPPPVTAVETGNDNPVAVISLLVAPAAAHIATPASADA